MDQNQLPKRELDLKMGVAVEPPGIIYLSVRAITIGPGNLPGSPPNGPTVLKAAQPGSQGLLKFPLLRVVALASTAKPLPRWENLFVVNARLNQSVP